MPEWQAKSIKKSAERLSGAFRSSSLRRKAIVRFAKKHELIYFRSTRAGADETPVIRGSSAAANHVDVNLCIGRHADYDMSFVERTAKVEHVGYTTTIHRWYILQLDLKRARDLPFVFLGTKQQTKAYYARMLTARRDVRYLSLQDNSEHSGVFHSTYALLASPAEQTTLYKLFTDDVIDSIATYKYPFAIEIEDDSLTILTEAQKPSEQLLDELLHYGLWLAKRIDEKFA